MSLSTWRNTDSTPWSTYGRTPRADQYGTNNQEASGSTDHVDVTGDKTDDVDEPMTRNPSRKKSRSRRL